MKIAKAQNKPDYRKGVFMSSMARLLLTFIASLKLFGDEEIVQGKNSAVKSQPRRVWENWSFGFIAKAVTSNKISKISKGTGAFMPAESVSMALK